MVEMKTPNESPLVIGAMNPGRAVSHGMVEIQIPNYSLLLVDGVMNPGHVVSHAMVEMQIPNDIILLVHGARSLGCVYTHGFNAMQITNFMLIHAILWLCQVVSKGAHY